MISFTCTAHETAAPGRVAEDDKPFLLTYPNLENPTGQIVLTNTYVVLQRLLVPVGEWEGVHSHPGNQVYVHIKGGAWSGRINGGTEYSDVYCPAGNVGWLDAIPLSVEHDSGNTGTTPIDLVYITLKGDSPISPKMEHPAQTYPNVAADLLLENDRVIVQRVVVEPGEWTGVHGHPGNQVCVHITGGTWSERVGGVRSATSQYMEAGSVGWIEPHDVGEGHDVGNTGDVSSEFVLVTIK